MDLLPAARGAPQAHEEHEPVGRFNQELKRRTLVLRLFPDEASCLRLIRAVAAEQHEEWLEGSRSLEAALLRERSEQAKTTMKLTA